VDYEVTAIERPYGVFGHDAITAIGNHRDGWSVSTASALYRLLKRKDSFYVIDPLTGHRVPVVAMRDKSGKTMLRAMTDGRATNHLLALRPLRDCNLID
jgi:hypothetical protein